MFGFTETDITVSKQEGQGSVGLDVIKGGTMESLNLFGSFNVKAVPLTAGMLCKLFKWFAFSLTFSRSRDFD